ncbi:MAG: hybrid sensor histidine kinase/response regulator [Candidatus Gastranaerophilales bacterium]|nr:hybrid sensor histidine kinase/response regulator [Candidatus Gastranaerophilales bacterium]
MDFLEEEIIEILNIFREEGEEIVQRLNQNLLKLESNPTNANIISELFRDAHSIKGSARMTGLNDIQALAHKLEDILGYAKEEKLTITPAIVDTLCKTVDCISSIIDKSVETKGEYHSEQTDKILILLEDIEKKIGDSSETPKEKNIEKPSLKAKNEITATPQLCEDISVVIKEATDEILRLQKNSTDTSAILKLQNQVSDLSELVVCINSDEIQNGVSELKAKLEGVIRGSGILLDSEVEEITETFENFAYKLKLLAIELNIDFPELSVLKRVEEEPDNSDNSKTSDMKPEDINSLIEFISQNFLSILEFSEESAQTSEIVKSCLEKIISLTKNKDVKKIFEKINEIFGQVLKSPAKPDKEIVEVIKQSFETGVKIAFLNEETDENPTLIIQRLTILHHMLDLSAKETEGSAQDFQKNEMTVSQTDVISKEQEESKKEDYKPVDSGTIKTLRVDTRKLDQLVSQVGELIISKIKTKEHLTELEKISRTGEDWYREWGKVKHYVKYIDKKFWQWHELDTKSNNILPNKAFGMFFEEGSTKLMDLVNKMNSLYRTIQEDDARLNLIINGLEEMVKSVRVLPLATVFHMFPRMVRDISREKNKKIELEISGSETSVDKKIIEEIKSPLMHIIRNSIDHGIETPEQRANAGKNPTGKIYLSAHHLENSVLIEITDDGKGIDLEAVKRKALEKNLLNPTELETMSESQIMNIVFWPGFSTGETVTDISGRGVGLDVVHTKITQLNGKVNIKSKFGEGCRISIQLPVTMATIPSFLVSVNKQTFAIPTSTVKTAFWINKKEIFKKEGKDTIIYDNKTLSVCKLSQILEMSDIKNDFEKVVVVVLQAEDMQVGFIIDKLLGDQEILHKKLTPPLVRVRNIAGITTLGSGELCLILNINDLIKSAFYSFNKEVRRVVNPVHVQESTEKKKVLVVDDSATTRILERNILRASGYDVTVATNGLDALTLTSSEDFDIVISDVEMPEMTGIELVTRLRENSATRNLPLILVTSLCKEEDKQKGFNAGANAYIVKGKFNQQELLSTIKKLLEE